jgi:alcohol dehydrogenase class IV
MFSGVQSIKKFISDKKFKRIFILTGKKSYVLSGAKKIFPKLLRDKEVNFYYKVSSFPTINELKKIIISLKRFSPDLIMAIGGGCVLDYAKAANTISIDSNLNKKIIYNKVPLKKICKLAAIPTTAGSGAEVTSNAVIYIDKIKYSIEGDLIKPDYFFLLPELVIKNSKKIKSSSGFDAIAQAVESMLSKKSNLKSIYFAKKSLKISLKNYLDYLKNPNYNNSQAMCLAANLSGKAISISKTTAPHAVSYPFTSLYNISHGHAVSLTLEKFLKFNFINLKNSNCNFDLNQRYKNIFNIFNVKDIFELEKFFIYMKKSANLESNFEKLGINMNLNINKILDGINIQRLKNNPIDLNKSDLKYILLKSR